MKFALLVVSATMSLSLVFVATAYAQYQGPATRGIRSEILAMTAEINQAVRNDELSEDQLVNVHSGLAEILNGMSGPRGSSLICSKASNGLFYPTSAVNGQVVGSTSSNAGYSNFDDCKANLPMRGTAIACFKQANGLFFPSSTKDGSIIGSSSSNAGHSTAGSCRMTLPKRGDSLACYKQANGLFYPSNPNTGEIIGSSSSNAGYSDLSTCLKVISQ